MLVRSGAGLGGATVTVMTGDGEAPGGGGDGLADGEGLARGGAGEEPCGDGREAGRLTCAAAVRCGRLAGRRARLGCGAIRVTAGPGVADGTRSGGTALQIAAPAVTAATVAVTACDGCCRTSRATPAAGISTRPRPPRRRPDSTRSASLIAARRSGSARLASTYTMILPSSRRARAGTCGGRLSVSRISGRDGREVSAPPGRRGPAAR